MTTTNAGFTVGTPGLRLIGTDGNAFAVLGAARKAAKKAAVPPTEIDAFMAEAMSGDYNNLLATCMRYFEVS